MNGNEDGYRDPDDLLMGCLQQYTYRWAEGCDYSIAAEEAATSNDGVIKIGYVNNILTLNTCAANCAVNELCNYFSYDVSRQLCRLLHHSFNQHQLQAHPDSLSECGYIIA